MAHPAEQLRVRIVGSGRAGGAFAGALTGAGWTDVELFDRAADLAGAADGVDLVLIATPDDRIADVAAEIAPVPDTVIAHVAGAVGLGVLAPHVRIAGIHPLVALPDAETGAARLRGAWFGLAGEPLVEQVVAVLDGRSFVLQDEHRVAYHAAAVIASNHLVALLGQVERVAAPSGAPLEAYLALVRGTVENVAELGPAAALTGPIARGDEATVERHLAAIDPSERPAYEALADAARRLAGREPPPTGRRVEP